MTKRNQDFSKDILSLIRSSVSPAVLSERLQDFHENDLAEVLRELSTAERSRLYRILESSMLADVFEYLEEEETVQYLEEMDVKKAAAILSRMETDALADVLNKLEKAKKKILIDLLEPEVRRDVEMIASFDEDEQVRKDIEMIRSFDEDEIGSRMTTNCIVIRENLTVKQAMSELVSQAADNDNISTIFAVTDRGEFYGALDLKDLITARQDHPMEELIVTSYPYVYGTEQIDDCMERLKDYSEDSIPVLDDDNRFLGVITSAGIIDLVDDEMGEDYAKLAGLTAEEDLKEPLFESMKKRMPWLIVLLGLGMLVSSVVGMFEKVVTCLPIIMCFQSLILDMAGNVGTQSLAVTIRVLMDETLTGRQKAELVLKEMRIGLCNGGLLGILSFVLIGLYIFLFKGKTLVFAYAVSGCIGLSLLVAMLVSSAVGTCIPLFFKKVGVDPAVASGPLITTVNDLVAVITYYGMSWIFLIEMFHLAG